MRYPGPGFGRCEDVSIGPLTCGSIAECLTLNPAYLDLGSGVAVTVALTVADAFGASLEPPHPTVSINTVVVRVATPINLMLMTSKRRALTGVSG